MQLRRSTEIFVHKQTDFFSSLLGEFYADLLVEDQLVVELKAVRVIVSEHVAQILGYLHSLRIETGLLINFGAPVLSVKKYLMSRPH
jgi:GxxExxY protein